MFVKKSPASAVLSSSSLPSALVPPPPRRCYSQSQPHRAGTSPKCTSPLLHCPQTRAYSTSDRSGSKHSTPAWPTKANPSPYDVLGLKPKEPYNKARYYQLVKIYHPDIQASTSPIPTATRLERYRLIVAANNLLSNPDKRHTYDTHGIGWHLNDGSHAEVRQADRNWRHQPGSPAMNATWEDWERWRQDRETRGKKQEPLYMSNAVFASLVGAAGIIGALLMEQGAEGAGAHLVELQGVRNHAVGQQMRSNAMASAGLSKDERVYRFLRDRENVEYSFSPGKYENGHDDDNENK
uniref:J domain-containing protein n=1 Tax=Bionectria ochroleuca TaxID=29856 RepID=A0A8H7NIQ4_BIOOC